VIIQDGGGTNTLVLGSSLTLANITFGKSGNDLILTDGMAGDQVDLYYQEYSGWPNNYKIQTIAFGDGSTLALSPALSFGSAGGTLAGTSGNDTLLAGQGQETLNGNGGSDTFIASTGTNTLIGGSSNDTYLFYRGNGRSTVVDSAGSNVVSFASGIAKDQLWFAQSGNDLLVSVIGTSQSINVQGWYANSANQNETFETADGAVLANKQVANLVNAMAGITPPGAGQTTLTSDQATRLEPVIAANWH